MENVFDPGHRRVPGSSPRSPCDNRGTRRRWNSRNSRTASCGSGAKVALPKWASTLAVSTQTLPRARLVGRGPKDHNMARRGEGDRAHRQSKQSHPCRVRLPAANYITQVVVQCSIKCSIRTWSTVRSRMMIPRSVRLDYRAGPDMAGGRGQARPLPGEGVAKQRIMLPPR
jgi:hypothetical protein